MVYFTFLRIKWILHKFKYKCAEQKLPKKNHPKNLTNRSRSCFSSLAIVTVEIIKNKKNVIYINHLNISSIIKVSKTEYCFCIFRSTFWILTWIYFYIQKESLMGWSLYPVLQKVKGLSLLTSCVLQLCF